jgi:sec-independent protein translocase protein TatA
MYHWRWIYSPQEALVDLFSPRHLIVILVIVLLVFGTKKLKTIGSDLGGAVRGFKKAMKDGDEEQQAEQTTAPAPQIEANAAKDAEFPPAGSETRSAQKNPPA